MDIYGATWSAKVNYVHIRCDRCKREFKVRADRWRVRCKCGKEENLAIIRSRFHENELLKGSFY